MLGIGIDGYSISWIGSVGNILIDFCNKSLFSRVSFFNVLFSWADRLGRRPEFPKVRPRYGNGVKGRRT